MCQAAMNDQDDLYYSVPVGPFLTNDNALAYLDNLDSGSHILAEDVPAGTVLDTDDAIEIEQIAKILVIEVYSTATMPIGNYCLAIANISCGLFYWLETEEDVRAALSNLADLEGEDLDDGANCYVDTFTIEGEQIVRAIEADENDPQQALARTIVQAIDAAKDAEEQTGTANE